MTSPVLDWEFSVRSLLSRRTTPWEECVGYYLRCLPPGYSGSPAEVWPVLGRYAWLVGVLPAWVPAHYSPCGQVLYPQAEWVIGWHVLEELPPSLLDIACCYSHYLR